MSNKLKKIFCKIIIFLTIFLLILIFPIQAQNDSPLELAESVKLQPGFSFNIQPNVFGFNMNTNSDIGIRKIKITEVIPDKNIKLSWEIKNKVNDKIVTTTGELTADIFNQPSGLLLPSGWPKGQHNITDNTLIWLNKKSFKELKTTGKTKWKASFYENPMAELSQTMGEIKKSLSDKTTEKKETQKDFLNAGSASVKYSVNINGKTQVVQGISASTDFIDLIILDNSDNPLILKAMLKPAMSGSFDIMAPFIILKTFLGYEITDIYI